MDLPLHQWCSVDEAVAALGGGAVGEALCDGQFVALPTVVLSRLTLDGTAAGSHLPDSLRGTSPSDLPAGMTDDL